MASERFATLGKTALRAACMITLRRGSPLATAIRTKSSAIIVIIMLRIPSIHPATELKTMVITGNSP